MLKNGEDLLDHWTRESGVSYKSFYKLRRLIEWFLYAVSDLIIFGLTTNVLCIFRRIPPDVFLGKSALQICSKFTGEHPC